MIPNSRYFPTSLQERAAWFNNLYNQFQTVAVSLGFVAADVTKVENDNNVVQFVASVALGLDAYKDAAKQFRVIITEGSVGEPTPAFPANPGFVAPTAVPTGIFERLDDLVKRIRVAPAYTNEIGALLGILPTQTSGPQVPEVDLQPSLKTVSLPGSVVQVKFVRGNTNGVVIETRIDNSETWSDAGKFYNSPATLVIPANTQNLPRSVQVRARFVDKDTPVGQFSDIVTTTTNPAG